jgi:hypothetical protein
MKTITVQYYDKDPDTRAAVAEIAQQHGAMLTVKDSFLERLEQVGEAVLPVVLAALEQLANIQISHL